MVLPVHGEAIAVAESAVGSETVVVARDGGAHAIVARHSVQMLLMLGQDCVCLRVACTQHEDTSGASPGPCGHCCHPPHHRMVNPPPTSFMYNEYLEPASWKGLLIPNRPY